MKFLQSLLQGPAQQAAGAYSNLLAPASEENFQSSVVDPALRTYKQKILPSIFEGYGSEGGSSALNQALAGSAEDLSNVLAGQRMGYQHQMIQAAQCRIRHSQIQDAQLRRPLYQR